MSETIETKLGSLQLDDYKKVEVPSITKSDIGKKVKIFGWITSVRMHKNMTFFELTSHFVTVKCVYTKSLNLTLYTSLTVYATVCENYSKGDSFEFELQVEFHEVYNNIIAPSFPLNKESSSCCMLDNGHLALRMEERVLSLKCRSALLKVIRDYYYDSGYTEITPPTLVQTQVEGGSTLFQLKYYGADAYLTQSSQLYLETVVPVAHRAFCIASSYRAENSKTTRHLCEYTHVEAELADITFNDLMTSIENLVVYALRNFYEKMGEEIKRVFPDYEFFEIPKTPFKRMQYSEAIDFLISNDYRKDNDEIFMHGDDIPDAAERFLVKKAGNGAPMFLTHFLVEHKPFYMKKEGDRLTQSCDLLFPGVGEILGGSMRLDVYKELLDGFKRENIKPDPYYWYLDMAKFGPCMHGGYGLGFERLMMAIMRYKHIDQACLYPRRVKRCLP